MHYRSTVETGRRDSFDLKPASGAPFDLSTGRQEIFTEAFDTGRQLIVSSSQHAKPEPVNWGRARPANVGEFGGTAAFTPPLWPADECLRNCSFVSGEASGATALAVTIWLLSAPIRPPWLRHGCRALAVGICLVCSSFRVVAGRHFLSDVVFAVLLVTGIALVLLKSQRAE